MSKDDCHAVLSQTMTNIINRVAPHRQFHLLSKVQYSQYIYICTYTCICMCTCILQIKLLMKLMHARLHVITLGKVKYEEINHSSI